MTHCLIFTQCFPPNTGGIESLMYSISHGLSERGYKVDVFADGEKNKNSWPFNVERFNSPKLIRKYLKAGQSKRISHSIDAVITDSWKSLEYLPREFNTKKIICLAHGMEYPFNPGFRKRKRIIKTLQKADFVCTNSKYSRSLVTPYCAEEKLRIIHPAIPHQEAPSQELLIDISNKSILITTLSRLEPRKGIDRVIIATHELRKEFKNLHLAIAGDGEDRKRLLSLTKELQMEECIQFLGRITDQQKSQLLSQSDIFAMPSRREGNSVEGFGIVYIEAAYWSTPAIASQDTGAVDAVLDHETGLLCDGNSQDSVTSCLRELVKNDQLRERLSDNARSHAMKYFSEEVIIQKYIELIKSQVNK